MQGKLTRLFDEGEPSGTAASGFCQRLQMGARHREPAGQGRAVGRGVNWARHRVLQLSIFKEAAERKKMGSDA